MTSCGMRSFSTGIFPPPWCMRVPLCLPRSGPSTGSFNSPATVRFATSTFTMIPENSQLAIRKRPSAVKSMWSTPAQGTELRAASFMVWAS